MIYFPEHNTSLIDCTFGILKKDIVDFNINDEIVKNNRGIINDIVYIKNKEVVGIKSRSQQYIAGILYLNKNTKYGKNSKGMCYYKFKPLNSKFPNFLVPSSLKERGKYYISIKFNNWKNDSKYPIGICDKVIGEVGDIKADAEILLYKYDLIYKKLKFNKEKIETDIMHYNNCKISDVDYEIFTIDPIGCKDIDDGISINKSDNKIEIGVHITDVTKFFTQNDIEYLSNNLSTSIYTIFKQINMIPDVYATNICSLLENTYRNCISVIYTYKDGILEQTHIKETLVYVKKNWDYDNADKEIKNRGTYLNILSDFMNITYAVSDTHKIIECLMIKTNEYIGKILYKYNAENTILRTHRINIKKDKVFYNNDIAEYLKFREYNAAIYQKGSINPNHSGLNIIYYTHFTSPIRRIVDMITHINVKKYLNKENVININTSCIMHINNLNKRIKKLNRDERIIELLNKNIEKYDSTPYIIDIDENKLILYFVELNFEYKFYLKNKYLDTLKVFTLLYDTKNNINGIEIEFLNNNEKKIYLIGEKIKSTIYMIHSEDLLKDKIKIILH